MRLFQKNMQIFLLITIMLDHLDLEMLGEEIKENIKKYNVNLDWELLRIGKFKKYKKIVILGGGNF